jgi:hypothetical protein
MYYSLLNVCSRYESLCGVYTQWEVNKKFRYPKCFNNHIRIPVTWFIIIASPLNQFPGWRTIPHWLCIACNCHSYLEAFSSISNLRTFNAVFTRHTHKMVNYFIAERPYILGYGMPCQLLSSSGILDELSASNFRASPVKADFCLLWEIQPLSAYTGVYKLLYCKQCRLLNVSAIHNSINLHICICTCWSYFS